MRQTVVSGLMLSVVVLPVLGQVRDPAEGQAELDRQRDEAIRALFPDLVFEEVEGEGRLVPAVPGDVDRAFERLRIRGLVGQDELGQAELLEINAKPFVSPWAERSREDVVAALSHADFAVRESAEGHLLRDETLSSDLVEGLIRQSTSLEARQRLLRVAEHHLMRQLRKRDFANDGGGPQEEEIVPGIMRFEERPASIGYSFRSMMAHENPYVPLPGVTILATMPGFPGYAHLRRGDIIVQIAGNSPGVQMDEGEIDRWVAQQIRLHEPGDTVALTVLRGGESLAIELVCAPGNALNRMYATNAFRPAARNEPYESAWREFYEQLASDLPKPTRLVPKAVELAE